MGSVRPAASSAAYFCSSVNYKAVNWETRQGDGYTTEEYEAFSAAFNAATKA